MLPTINSIQKNVNLHQNSHINEDTYIGKPPFIQLDFQINNVCNARCNFCKIWERPDYNSPDLPAEYWISTAAKLKKLTNIEYICIAGGEPLLYKDLIKVVKGLSDLQITSSLVTNGSLMNKKMCNDLLDAGISNIDFSIDNFAEKHNKTRAIPKLFETCVKAISTIKKINPNASVGLSTLIYEENIDDLPIFLDWVLENLPITKINFQAYNRVLQNYKPHWWEKDPLWPKNKESIIKTLDYLKKRAEEEPERINNLPLQFEKFKKYFLNPNADLGIKCPAGTLNFPIDSQGNVSGCVMESPVGNIKNDNPIEIYNNKFIHAREKAKTCKENCHFLINCYFPAHWKKWNIYVKDMVEDEDKNRKLVYKPGKTVLPPEVREIAKKGIPGYPDIIKYKIDKKFDWIGKYDDIENRKSSLPAPKKIQVIYLCGDTSENHRWGVDLDENDFFKQIDKLKEVTSKGEKHHVIIGIRRTNFHRLDRIVGLVIKLRKSENKIPSFNILPLQDIKYRLYDYLEKLSPICSKQSIEFRIIDSELDNLLMSIENNSKKQDFNQSMFLRSLGPVIKDVFIGPENILLDLTGKCNLDCVYCRKFSPWNKKYWDGQHSELFGKMDFRIIKNILLEAKELGTKNVFLVGGAEPTMHPKFLDIINLIRELNMYVYLVTNGSMLHLYNEHIIDGTMKEISISLSYASEKSWKLVRPNSPLKLMKKIEDNILQLSELKKKYNTKTPTIRALYVINQYNFTEIVDMAYHAKKIGADVIWYQLVHLENFSVDKLYLKKSDMDFVKKELEKAKEVCKKIGMEYHSFIDFEIKHYDKNSGSWGNKGLLSQGCYVGWCFTYVSLRREVFMCCGARMIGLLEKEGSGLKNIWLSEAYTRYRNDGLIMHKENPITLYGRRLYDDYCDSCDNHDQNTMMIDSSLNYDLLKYVER